MSLVAYQSSSEDEQDLEITKTSTESITSGYLKRKEPVKIAIPSLDEFDVESEEPTKKPKIKASSGLLSLLPAPKHTALSAALVPASVKKKEAVNKDLPNASSSSVMKLKNRVGKTLVEESCSEVPLEKEIIQNHEDDVLPSNFFSLDSKPTDEGSSVSDFFSLSATSNSGCSLSSKSCDIKDELLSLPGPLRSFNSIPPVQNYESLIPHEPGNYTVDSPEYQPPEYETNTSYQECASSSWSANVPSDDKHQSTAHTSEILPTEPTPIDMMNDERFQRLQGKRRREFDDLNIIDVNVDNQLSDKSQWLTKSITEEKKVSFSRKKGELPTQQQRRKHQITYLAFQAKERELDLKNQWAQNRLTKRETQSKYGF